MVYGTAPGGANERSAGYTGRSQAGAPSAGGYGRAPSRSALGGRSRSNIHMAIAMGHSLICVANSVVIVRVVHAGACIALPPRLGSAKSRVQPGRGAPRLHAKTSTRRVSDISTRNIGSRLSDSELSPRTHIGKCCEACARFVISLRWQVSEVSVMSRGKIPLERVFEVSMWKDGSRHSGLELSTGISREGQAVILGSETLTLES